MRRWIGAGVVRLGVVIRVATGVPGQSAPTLPPPAAGARPDGVRVIVGRSEGGNHATGTCAPPRAPEDMVLIPAGSFTMGNSADTRTSFTGELPLHAVYVSAFHMDRCEVCKAKWDGVYAWAANHGYRFDNAGCMENGASRSKGPNHPVYLINWYDIVKWCNARSEEEGRIPAYYISAAQTNVYRTGDVDLQSDWVKWDVGYRLPTEAEWEKAARGGAEGHRFSWSDADTIQHARANYCSSSSYAYDTSLTRGHHPAYALGGYPYTSPVGSFPANGHGLFDMTGNVSEWCWDWFDEYYWVSPGSDPRGPSSGSYRVSRGGGWNCLAGGCRVSDRGWPGEGNDALGFRAVLPTSL